MDFLPTQRPLCGVVLLRHQICIDIERMELENPVDLTAPPATDDNPSAGGTRLSQEAGHFFRGGASIPHCRPSVRYNHPAHWRNSLQRNPSLHPMERTLPADRMATSNYADAEVVMSAILPRLIDYRPVPLKVIIPMKLRARGCSTAS